jgi:hypothetical protein
VSHNCLFSGYFLNRSSYIYFLSVVHIVPTAAFFIPVTFILRFLSSEMCNDVYLTWYMVQACTKPHVMCKDIAISMFTAVSTIHHTLIPKWQQTVHCPCVYFSTMLWRQSGWVGGRERWGVEVQLHAFLTSVSICGSKHFTRNIHWVDSWLGPRAGPDVAVKREYLVPAGNQSMIPQISSS